MAVWLLSVNLLSSCQRDVTPVPTPLAVELQEEENQVYSDLFDEIYGEPRMYVLREMSSPGMDGVEALDSILETYLSRFTNLETTTADNFRLRNETSVPLPADLELGLPYILLTEANFDQIFALNTSGWSVFYDRYPNSPGMTTISRIGFNDTLTQAVLYAATWSNWLAGAGYYYLLEKVDDTWQIIEQVLAWIS